MNEQNQTTVTAPGRLVYANGNGTTTFPLPTAKMTLGSEEGNDIIIKRPKVSRAHARIDYDGRRWTVTDLDSVAGTLVNQELITQTRLADGDMIGIGAAMLRFETSADDQTSNGNGAQPDQAAEAAKSQDPSAQNEQTIEVENDPPLNDKQAEFTSIEALVEVQTTGDKRPLFIVAAGYNDVAQYTHLAAHLGEDQPLYVLQVPVTPSKAQPTDAIELLAAHHIKAMRSIQEEGPYQVGGYGIGGIVAFEIARQLRMAGDSLATLVLIDTPYPMGNALPHMGYRNAQTVDQLNRRLLEPMQGLGQINLGQQLAGMMSGLSAKLDFLRTPQMRQMSMDYDAFVGALADRGFEINLALTQSYQPEIYADRVVLILAEHSPVRYANTQWEWSKKAPNGLESRLVSGSFGTILHDPDVAGLATQIVACLHSD